MSAGSLADFCLCWDSQARADLEVDSAVSSDCVALTHSALSCVPVHMSIPFTSFGKICSIQRTEGLHGWMWFVAVVKDAARRRDGLGHPPLRRDLWHASSPTGS